MSVTPSQCEKYSAFITGAASGIGRHLAVALAQKLPVVGFTLVDLDVRGLDETKQLIESKVSGLSIICAALDVSDEKAQQEEMVAHAGKFGGKNKTIWVLNAGIGEAGDLFDKNNTRWQRTYQVDYASVVSGLRSLVLATREPQASDIGCSSRGIVLVVASASAVFPLPSAPVYSSAKAGAMMLVRSTAERLARSGIKCVALCPEFVETPLVTTVIKEGRAAELFGKSSVALLQADHIAEVSINELIMDVNPITKEENRPGTVLIVTQKGKTKRFPSDYLNQEVKSFSKLRPSKHKPTSAELAHYASWAQRDWPSQYKKFQVYQLSNNFREATRLVTVPLPPLSSPLPPGHLLIRRVGVGVNASDVNRTSGRYHGSLKKAREELPFDAGFETVSVVAAVADDLKSSFHPGQAVASMTYDGYATYAMLDAKLALLLPRPSISYITLLTSGLTASIALSETVLGSNRLGPGKTVLITAAAGGTGAFAVQLAKLAGAHVIATCGGPEKVKMVQNLLGADRVVDYKRESLKEVLRAEYPRGVDIVYESIGGEMFSICLDALADKGTLIVIGMMGEYSSGWKPSTFPGLTEKLLWKSASCVGFFLLKYASLFRQHLDQLVSLLDEGKIVAAVDKRCFVGIEVVPDAVEFLQSGNSSGKVIVQLASDLPPLAPLSSKM